MVHEKVKKGKSFKNRVLELSYGGLNSFVVKIGTPDTLANENFREKVVHISSHKIETINI